MGRIIEIFTGSGSFQIDKPVCPKCKGNHYVLKPGLDKSKKDLHLDPKNFTNCSSCIDNLKNAS